MFRIILLCLLTCCSSFMPLKQSESIVSEDHIQVVEKKTKVNYVQTSSGYYEYGCSDLFSSYFLEALIHYYVNDLGVTALSPGNNTEMQNGYVIQTSGVYQTYEYRQDQRAYSLMYNVSNIVMQKVVTDSSSSFPQLRYTWILSNSSPYDKQIGFEFYAQRTDDMRLTIWGIALITPTNYSSPTWLYPRFMLSEKIGGYNSFVGNIFHTIQGDPYANGYNTGYDNGLSSGREVGERIGYQIGYEEGEVAGYTTGYNTGVSDTIASGSEAMTIFAGIMDVAFIPVNVFFLMFDYEVFGINIAGFVSGLISIAIVIILMRFIFGRKV